MTDTILKGTGNSRTLASIANFLTVYPTYDAFAAALIAGTLPIDIGPLNAAGCNAVGTSLNKANILTDDTCSKLSIPSSSVPDEAFSRLWSLIVDAQNYALTAQRNLDNYKATVLMQSGSYYGNQSSTGSSQNKQRTISLSFHPKVVVVASDGVKFLYTNNTLGGIAVTGIPAVDRRGSTSNKLVEIPASSSAKYFYVYHQNYSSTYGDADSCNLSGEQYTYFALSI